MIVLSGTRSLSFDAAFDSGAAAYVLKRPTRTRSPRRSGRRSSRPSSWHGRRERPVPDATDNQLLAKLTRRELEILQLVSGGRSNRQVAEILWVADQTVKFHLANIYRKLGVRSRFEAARWARESGILDVVVEPDAGEAMSEGLRKGGVSRALVPLRSPRTRPKGVTGRYGETSR